MRERVRNVLVGACAIGAIGSASALLFLFGEIESVFVSRWPVEVAFNEAGGLRKGSLVTLNGVPIGAVERVEIWNDRDQPVLVTAMLDDGVLLPDPSVPSVQASLLGSGARLELTAVLPLPEPRRHYPVDGTVRLRGRVQPIETRVIDQLDRRLEPMVRSFGELGALARSLEELVRAPSVGEDGAKDGAKDGANLRRTIARLDETLDAARGAIASATTWLDDEQLRTDLRDAAARAGEFLRDASLAANRIETLAASVEADASALRDGALPVLERAGASLAEFERLLAAARQGDGTVGRLLKDPALFENLSDAARRLDEALAKVNLLLDKIREEGVAVDLFGGSR
jgi:phospholipid/cholesterol/gamma-HCH transport system substrate-binding protein